jgi:hypothetical protein
VFGKQSLPGAPPRLGAVVWNKHACDPDQDGTLDEAALFGATSAGAQAAQGESLRAATAVALRRAALGPGVQPASSAEEEAAVVAGQRALLANILSRNQGQIERLPKNPGGRDAAAGHAAWRACADGPDGSLPHFDPKVPLAVNVDAALATAMDPNTYQGNFPLYVRDLYLAENKAQLTGSVQMKRILAPLAAPGPLAGTAPALNPPPRRFFGDPHAAARAVGLGGGSSSGARRGQRPSTAPVGGFGFTGSRGAPPGWEDAFAGTGGVGAAAALPASRPVGSGSLADGPAFTSAYKVATFYESDHLESYEGQWQHSKTIAPTARGVRQSGEVGPGPGGGRRAGVSREGRATVTRHLGPSRTTAGLLANAAEETGSTLNATAPVAPGPPGRWAAGQRGRQLPAVLLDYATQEGSRAPFYELRVYNRDLATSRRSVQSAVAWKDLARGHEARAWTRPPNTGMHGALYNATVPREPEGRKNI